MPEKLKPCPFCGGEGALRKINVNEYVAFLKPRYFYEVHCLDCQVFTPLCINKEGAINGWNRRADNAN